MKNSQNTSKSAKISITSKVVQAIKSSFEEPKRFINHDGTIAESHSTYKEFRMDLIKSLGYGC